MILNQLKIYSNKLILIVGIIFFLALNSNVVAKSNDLGTSEFKTNIFATEYIKKNKYATEKDNQIFDLLYSAEYTEQFNNLMDFLSDYKYYYIGFDTIYFWNSEDLKIFAMADNLSWRDFPARLIFHLQNVNPGTQAYMYSMSVSDAINGIFDNITTGLYNNQVISEVSAPYFIHKNDSSSRALGCVSQKNLEDESYDYSFIGWFTNTYINYYVPKNLDTDYSWNYYSKIKILDTVYESYSILYSPRNIYNQDIDCSDKSKIIVEFDAPLDEDYLFDFDFKIKTDKSSNLPTPTMRSDKDSNIHIEEIMNKIETDNGYEYSGKFGLDVVKNNKFKFVIDVKNYKNILNLYFETNLNYEVSYVYDKDDDNYYKSINMKDIYGLYLMPKTLSNENMQAIYLKGRYDIEFRKNYTDNGYDVEDKFIDYSNEILEVKSLGNEYNNLIYFVNLDYSNGDDDYYIKFDTRYYNYTIKEYAYSSPEIENPNTGDVIQLPEMDVIGPGAENSLSDYLNSARNFIQSISIYIREYMGVISYLFTSFPNMVKSGIITLFIIFVICCLIKVGRG